MADKQAKEIASLRKRLAKLEKPSQAAQKAKKKPKTRTAASGTPKSAGAVPTFRLRHTEMLVSLSADATKETAGKALLELKTLGYAAKFAAVFSRIQWHSATVWYVGSASMTQPGLVSFGVAGYDPEVATITRKWLSGLAPLVTVAQHAVKSQAISVPRSLLASRPFFQVDSSDYSDRVPASIMYAVDKAPAGGVGELWITYDVTLSAPHA